MPRIHMSYIGPLGEYNYRVSENPIEEIWHLLDLSASEDMILEHIDKSMKKEVVSFIAESVAQAEEFDLSSTSSTEHTKSLLLYYCFLHLTKAVLALLNKRITSSYHGLSICDIVPGTDLLDVSAKLKKGVFWDLLLLGGVTPTQNLRITLDELLRRCAYIGWEYKTAYGKDSMILNPSLNASISLSELEIKIRAPYGDLLKEWNTRLQGFDKYFELSESTQDHLIFRLNDNAPRGSLPKIRKILDDTMIFNVFAEPEFFLLPKDRDVYHWSQEAYLYAVSFILGSVVRYYPAYWHQEIIAKRKNRWLIRRLNWVMRRVYLNIMINFLFGQRFKFQSPM